MKAVMYHYVREYDERLPHQRFLHVDDFRRQLDWFATTQGFVDRASFERSLCTGEPVDGVILTFDDALRDHVETVVPELLDRGLWGIFYAATSPYRTGGLLQVHRLHHLTGRFDGPRLLSHLERLVEDDMLEHAHVEEFHSRTYGRLDDDTATDEFKRTLNYLIADEHRSSIIDMLMDELDIDERSVARRYYVAPDELREMHHEGMVIGSHSDSHVVLSSLEERDQRAEIEGSITTLRAITGTPVETFCYPFGGFHSFDTTSERILGDCGIRYAFNVESRDITEHDLLRRPTALPRYDCNAFRFGRATVGPTS